MTIYTIRVLNQSGFNKNYTVFMAPPRVNENGAPVTVLTNAWATFPSIVTGGFDSLMVDDSLYAFWSQAVHDIGPGVVVTAGGVQQVSIDARDEVAFAAGSPTGFQGVTAGKAQTGCYAIITSPDFTAADGFMFGMAKLGPEPVPTPVATFAAEPNDVFNIAPVQKFYVADLGAKPGEVVDLTGLTAIATIDFTGAPQTTATAVQNANGTFTVTYS
ncbi:hypothetical protein [Caulobacter sp.]|uniref:hypothetical protein n=1 Tax=Caulobacter sp. TaxID=78 RepID=UPI003BAE6542